jgi:hypothetical protein
MVKALVLRDGRPTMHLSASFQRIDPTLVTDPRWATDATSNPIAPSRAHLHK